MGKPESCQNVRYETLTEETSGGSWQDWEHKVVCEAPVSFYRSCGAGCKLVIALCDKHGGDSKAVDEMRIHIAQNHPKGVQ